MVNSAYFAYILIIFYRFKKQQLVGLKRSGWRASKQANKYTI